MPCRDISKGLELESERQLPAGSLSDQHQHTPLSIPGIRESGQSALMFVPETGGLEGGVVNQHPFVRGGGGKRMASTSGGVSA